MCAKNSNINYCLGEKASITVYLLSLSQKSLVTEFYLPLEMTTVYHMNKCNSVIHVYI